MANDNRLEGRAAAREDKTAEARKTIVGQRQGLAKRAALLEKEMERKRAARAKERRSRLQVRAQREDGAKIVDACKLEEARSYLLPAQCAKLNR